MNPESRASVTLTDSRSRLAALCAEYARLKPELDSLTERLGQITDAIKVEAGQRAWGCTTVDIQALDLDYTLRVQTRAKWHFDVKRFRAEYPEWYVQYAQCRQVTELRRVAR